MGKVMLEDNNLVSFLPSTYEMWYLLLFCLFDFDSENSYTDSKCGCEFNLQVSLFMGHLFFFIAFASFVNIKYLLLFKEE